MTDHDQRHRRLNTILTDDGTRLYGMLARLTTRGDVAADLLQDLFLQLAQAPSFATAGDPKAYAWRAAINLAMLWRRAHRRERRHLPVDGDDDHLSPADPSPSPLARLIDTEDAGRILDALPDLGELPRACFVLRLIEHQTYDQIARRLGKTPHQVRGHCHAAVRQLRAKLHTAAPPREAKRHV